ncbi:unnamed protein product [Ostreobium quekettii]|uniref:NB-ARC domain-containing protein n=1 Tax=Ostreobium quekettii TaxID=121088 RepID=A0A8S1IVL4_9CHLO|nr:unnamed protein product [Ostreobium quekettii]
MSRPVDLSFPMVASPPISNLYPNDKVYTFKFDLDKNEPLQMVQLTVVENARCPQLNGIVDSNFCVDARGAGMEPGCSGGPVILASVSPVVDIEVGTPENDVIAGVVSYTNYSDIENSGVVCVIASEVHAWIQNVTASREHEPDQSTAVRIRVEGICLGVGTTVLAVAVAVLVVLPRVAARRNRNPEDFVDSSGVGSFPGLGTVMESHVHQLGWKETLTSQELREATCAPPLPQQYVPRSGPVKEIVANLIQTTDQLSGLERREGSLRIRLSIEGLGGIGKTVLATAAVQDVQVQAAFKDGIFWVSCRQYGSPSGRGALPLLQEIRRRVLSLYRGQTFPFGTSETLGDGDWLAAINDLFRGRDCLVVLDDLRSKELLDEVEDLDCELLVTSQLWRLIEDAPHKTCLQVGPLAGEESRRLLENVAGNGVHRQEAGQLVASCGGHPLALVILGLRLCEVLDRDRLRMRSTVGAFFGTLSDPVCKFRVRMPPNADCLNPEDRERHWTLMRCFDFALDALDREERECYILLAALEPGAHATSPSLRTLWDMGSMEKAERMIFVLRMHCLLQPRRRERGRPWAWGLQPLQHDHVRAISMSNSQRRKLLEDRLRGWHCY